MCSTFQVTEGSDGTGLWERGRKKDGEDGGCHLGRAISLKKLNSHRLARTRTKISWVDRLLRSWSQGTEPPAFPSFTPPLTSFFSVDRQSGTDRGRYESSFFSFPSLARQTHQIHRPPSDLDGVSGLPSIYTVSRITFVWSPLSVDLQSSD